MFLVLICTFVGIWACAYAAVHYWPGRRGFWAFYVVALVPLPLLVTMTLKGIFSLVSLEYGASITPLSIQAGGALSSVAYPIKYLRVKAEK